MRLDNILQTVGNTPVIKLNRVGHKLACALYAKVELFNPGGSIKDRIALKMIEQAEMAGTIQPGDTLIEPTSGNTGIGMALAGAAKGYNIIITMPEKMSREKQVVLEALGATIYRTPTQAAWDHYDSHISLAHRLRDELPNAHILDQYANPNNPNAHSEHTAQEIIDAFPDGLDMAVMGVGTGGTITGVGRRLKAHFPDIKIIGVDPVGSILGGGTEVSSYEVEGIGYDFFPDVLDNNLIDQYIKTHDQAAFTYARRIIKQEGILVGGSSGSALDGALQAATNLSADQKCIVLFPDSIRNYLSKFVDDQWMRDNGFEIEP
jgi:cysteine synthase